MVPAARTVGGLVTAAALARELGWQLLVLCSHGVRAGSLRRAATDHELRPPLAAVDLPPRGSIRAHREWATPAHWAARQRADIDTHRKRNLALAAARMQGLTWVLFLDDDIRGLSARDVRAAVDLMLEPAPGPHGARWRIAGWSAGDFPDNSVVCHARREFTAGRQDTFVGGEALLVRLDIGVTNPFPPTYNEDWLFLYDALADREVLGGPDVRQLVYDPYADPARARREEFGDVLGEGLFHLLHERLPVKAAVDPDYWRPVRAARRFLLDEITEALRRRSAAVPPGDSRLAGALHAMAEARSQLTRATPHSLADFVVRWRQDVDTWQEWFAHLPERDTLEAAFAYLGLPPGAVVTMR